MITVFGSINADLLFRVETLPRPGETVLCPGYVVAPGGKGANQAVAAARAGAGVRFFGGVGDDDYGRTMRDNLAREGIDVAGVVPTDAPTGIAVIAVDDRAENQIIVASGAHAKSRAALVPDAALGAGEHLLLQMEVPPAESAALARRARARGARPVLNLAPAGLTGITALGRDAIDQLAVLVVNETEAAQMAGFLGLSGSEPAATARALAAGRDLTVVVTLGGAGALMVAGGALWSIGVLAIEPIDTTGAGDAFVGGFAAALDRGLAAPDALRHGSATAALACTKLGAQAALPYAAEIDAAAARLAAAVRQA
jgi:ribokinase